MRTNCWLCRVFKHEAVSETGPIEMDNRYYNNTYYVLWALEKGVSNYYCGTQPMETI